MTEHALTHIQFHKGFNKQQGKKTVISFGWGWRGGGSAEKVGSAAHHLCICCWQSKKPKFFYIKCIWIMTKLVYLISGNGVPEISTIH